MESGTFLTRVLITKLLVITFFQITFSTHNNSSGLQFQNGKSETVISFVNFNGFVIFPMDVNGCQLNFLLDTGTTNLILFNQPDLEEINFTKGPTIQIPALGSEDLIQADVIRNLIVKIGDIEGKGLYGAVIKKKPPVKPVKMKIHGIIGYQLFSRFIVRINYIQNKLILYEPAYFNPVPSELKIPLIIDKTRPYVQSNIVTNNDIINGTLMIDTGSNGSLLLCRDILKSEVFYDKRTSISLRGLGAFFRGVPIRINRVVTGPLSFHNVSAIAIAHKFKDTNRIGSIGSGLFDNSILTLDYLNQELYLGRSN